MVFSYSEHSQANVPGRTVAEYRARACKLMNLPDVDLMNGLHVLTIGRKLKNWGCYMIEELIGGKKLRVRDDFEQAASAPTSGKLSAVRILLVEDNPADVVRFQELLDSVDDFKMVFSRVSTLAAAIERVAEDQVDCIILDLNLPDSDGFETYQVMRKHAPSTAIIILSGQTEREVMNQALLKGADNYLLKGACDGNRIAVAVLCGIRHYDSCRD